MAEIKPRKSIAKFLAALAQAYDMDQTRAFIAANGSKLDEVAEAAQQLETGLMKALESITAGSFQGCRCQFCVGSSGSQDDLSCESCGYIGPYVNGRCVCPDYGGEICRPGGDTSEDGSSCSQHGEPTCPVCGSGQVDGMDLVRHVRDALEEALAALLPDT